MLRKGAEGPAKPGCGGRGGKIQLKTVGKNLRPYRRNGTPAAPDPAYGQEALYLSICRPGCAITFCNHYT